MKDHRPGVMAEPSRNPSSNRFGHPSSVCLLRVSRRAKRLPQRLHLWFRVLRCTCLSLAYVGNIDCSHAVTYAVVMSVEVRLALKSLGAWRVSNSSRARVWILSIGIVRLHVRLPIVATLEKLSADTAFVCSFFRCCPLTLLLDPVDARQDRC